MLSRLARHPSRVLLAACLVLAAAARPAEPQSAIRPAGYQFVSPLPASERIPRATTIAIRQGQAIDPATLAAGLVRVTGSRTAAHPGSLVLADDGRTLVFKPDLPFAAGETVSVHLDRGLRTAARADLPPLDFRFTIAPESPAGNSSRGVAALLRELAGGPRGPSPEIEGRDEAARPGAPRDGIAPVRPAGTIADSLPAGYVPITVLGSNDPDSGGIFMTPFTPNFNADRGRLAIVDHRGLPLYYCAWPSFVFDFKRQPNGLLTFFTLPATYIAMDSTYTVVDSFKTGNSYEADEHDLQLLPDGHALLMAYDLEPVGMDTVVAGGDPNARVYGLIIQELDTAKNVVFQWRSWDHFQITDMVECTGHLTDSLIDYVHANALELDADGNILLSSRHMNEITKIDRQSGDIVWRLGLNAKHNDFTFLDDARGFSHQHDIRRQPNGHITLFDNGNCLGQPPYSRAVEYELDEVNKTARLVWEHRNTPDVFGPFMGNQQRHADGGITIGWGGTGPDPKLTELHADGTRAFELGFRSPITWTYRAFRFPWQTTAFRADPEALGFGEVAVGETASRTFAVTNRLGTPLTLNQAFSTDARFTVTSPLPVVLEPGATDSMTVRFQPDTLGVIAGDLYVRAVNDTGLIARVVPLSGTGTGQALSINDVSGLEGWTGDVTPFVFIVRLASPAQVAVTFDFTTVDSTATVVGKDYEPIAGSAAFAVGDSLLTLSVNVYGDSIPEDNEVFFLQISNVQNAVVVRGRGRAVILQDEGILAAGDDMTPPARAALHAAQPNPAREETTLSFDLPVRERASLEVFDVRGRRVATLASGVLRAGRQSVTWDTRGRAAGIYFARLSAGGITLTRKLVVIP